MRGHPGEGDKMNELLAWLAWAGPSIALGLWGGAPLWLFLGYRAGRTDTVITVVFGPIPPREEDES